MTTSYHVATNVTDSSLFRDLSPAQAQAAMLIALGRRQRDVAKLIGVSHETVSRWWHIPDFALAVSENQRGFIGYAQSRHMVLVGKAVDRLEELLDHANPIVKLRAIALVLQPLNTKLPLKHAAVERTDEQDFQEFMRVFIEGTKRIHQNAS
jgi:hypothetical protein